MKKLVATLLILFAGPSWAQWVLYQRDMDGANYFYDPSTIQGENKKRVWTRVDHKSKNELGWHSARALQEYDCINKTYKPLQVEIFSGPSLQGAILNTIREKELYGPDHLAPDTIGHTLLTIICQKK